MNLSTLCGIMWHHEVSWNLLKLPHGTHPWHQGRPRTPQNATWCPRTPQNATDMHLHLINSTQLHRNAAKQVRYLHLLLLQRRAEPNAHLNIFFIEWCFFLWFWIFSILVHLGTEMHTKDEPKLIFGSYKMVLGRSTQNHLEGVAMGVFFFIFGFSRF